MHIEQLEIAAKEINKEVKSIISQTSLPTDVEPAHYIFPIPVVYCVHQLNISASTHSVMHMAHNIGANGIFGVTG